MPLRLETSAELPNLVAAMRAHGYGEALIAKLTHENWLSFLSRHLDQGRRQ
jgi:membrane dipeptidase